MFGFPLMKTRVDNVHFVHSGRRVKQRMPSQNMLLSTPGLSEALIAVRTVVGFQLQMNRVDMSPQTGPGAGARKIFPAVFTQAVTYKEERYWQSSSQLKTGHE